MRIPRFFAHRIWLTTVVIGYVSHAYGGILTFNSDVPANNATFRNLWLAAIGIGSPQNLVNFESGFANPQNVSGVNGLFPAGLIITDTSAAGQAIVRSGLIGGSNTVGTLSLVHNEQPFLVLNFAASPVDYIAFQDIDQAGTVGTVTFVGGGTAPISFETTGSGGDVAEFFGIFRNDMPRIVSVALDASGDGTWGIDTIEYGVVPQAGVPEPSTLSLAMGALGIAAMLWRRRRARHS